MLIGSKEILCFHSIKIHPSQGFFYLVHRWRKERNVWLTTCLLCFLASCVFSVRAGRMAPVVLTQLATDRTWRALDDDTIATYSVANVAVKVKHTVTGKVRSESGLDNTMREKNMIHWQLTVKCKGKVFQNREGRDRKGRAWGEAMRQAWLPWQNHPRSAWPADFSCMLHFRTCIHSQFMHPSMHGGKIC